MFELHKDERVILYIRRHWIFIFLLTKGIFLLFLLPVMLIWFLQIWGLIPDSVVFGVPLYNLTDILVYLWGLFCWMLLAEKFTDYALDFWIVTNKRIIEVEMVKLFDIPISTLELQDIEDLTVKSEGFWGNLFGFGRLEIQTAGTKNQFYAEHITHPERVQKIIFDAKLAYDRERQDIEKQEFEQVSRRVFREESGLQNLEAPSEPVAANPVKEKYNYDWARPNFNQKKEEAENADLFIEDVYKKNVENALRSGE